MQLPVQYCNVQQHELSGHIWLAAVAPSSLCRQYVIHNSLEHVHRIMRALAASTNVRLHMTA